MRAAIRAALFGPTLDPTTRAIVAAMTVAPSAARVRAIDAFVRALKTAGVWTSLDFMFIMAAHDVQAAKVDWRLPTRLITAGGGSPTFTTDREYAFNGSTDYLDSNFIPSTGGVAMTGTEGFLGVYERVNQGVNSVFAAGVSNVTGTSNYLLNPRTSGNGTDGRINSASMAVGSVTDSRGLTTIDRNGANFTQYKAGASIGTATPTVGSAQCTTSLFIGAARSNAGTVSSFRPCSIAAVVGGGTMTAAQHLALYTAMQAYLTTLGAAV